MRGIKLLSVCAVLLMMTGLAIAGEGVAGDDTAASAVVAQTSDERSKTTLQETSRLSESLIYSVDRTPERVFDTARSVDVITSEDIARRGGRGLADILTETAGVYVRRGSAGGGAAVIRGLAANQVLILLDGVKLTNGMWGDNQTEYLNLIDLSMIDRVEIVRGVVSVLGTESLGGIINIITKKGPPAGETFTGTVGLRYSTDDNGFRTPVSLTGQSGRLRYVSGLSFGKSGDLRAGVNVGRQDATGYSTTSGYVSTQYLLTGEKTISAMYSDVQQRGVQSFSDGLIGPIDYHPSRAQLGSVSYLDLTSRPWADSFRATTYWNRQTKGVDLVVDVPRLDLSTHDGDTLIGAGVEGGKFLGSTHVHHVVYGVDFSTEKTVSNEIQYDEDTHITSTGRSETTPGTRYRTLGVYLQDRFNVGRLSASLGARYGTFSLKGTEASGALGEISVDTRKNDYAGSLNLVYHLTSSVNLIGNAIRGFRTPNIYDATGEIWGAGTLLVPTSNLSTEHVNSFELGAKYRSDTFSGSAFLFRNNLSQLLVIGPGSLNGLTFYDSNFNRKRDPWEHIDIQQNTNVGAGRISGLELEGRVRLSDQWQVLGNYTRTTGTNSVTREPFPGIPPAFGALNVRYTPAVAGNFWGEGIFSFANSQRRLAPTERSDPFYGGGTPAMQVFSVRGGVTVAGGLSLMAEVQNVFNERYRYHDSYVWESGRHLILSTQFRF